MTMVMCDNDGCKFNNDRVCARMKIYCVNRRCMSAKRYGVIDLMRKPSWTPKEREWEIIKDFARILKHQPERAEKMVRELKELEN